MEKQINFKAETDAAKLKMIERGIMIPFKMGLQVKQMDYTALRGTSTAFIIENMRQLSTAFTEFVDPDVPELQNYGLMSRREVYFVLRSILLEKKREANRKEAAEIRKKLDGMKTKKEVKTELMERLKVMEA